MDSAAKAEDNRSSGWMLLIVGGAGLLVILLSFLGILPISTAGFSRKMVMGIMGALCVLFIVMGIVSFKNSKFHATQAKVENDKESEITKWFEENCTAEMVDGLLGEELFGLTEEEAYFKRYAVVRQLLYKNFPNAGLEFLERISDDVYEIVYGEEA